MCAPLVHNRLCPCLLYSCLSAHVSVHSGDRWAQLGRLVRAQACGHPSGQVCQPFRSYCVCVGACNIHTTHTHTQSGMLITFHTIAVASSVLRPLKPCPCLYDTMQHSMTGVYAGTVESC